MQNIKKICSELSNRLASLPYDTGDLADVGNEIGIILGKYINEDISMRKEDFLAGLNHGILLSMNDDKPIQ